MNIYCANNLINERVENFELNRRDKSKIFEISKIKKPNNSNNVSTNSKEDIIHDPKRMIFKEINISFIKPQNNKNISKQNIIQSNIDKTKQNSLKFANNTKKNKSKKNFSSKESKFQKANPLKRPILVGDNYNLENMPKIQKNKINSINPFVNNSKNNLGMNFNVGPLDNHVKFPFLFNCNLKNTIFDFDFTKFPFNQNLFKGNIINFQFNSNKAIINNFNKKENVNISFSNPISTGTKLFKTKFVLFKGCLKKRGRKSKSLKKLNVFSKHTKFSPDNMMRKLKNKIIESSRQLINKVLSDEIVDLKNIFRFPFFEFKKIKGIFSQELNVNFNLWFYQIKIRDILSMEISAKYSSLEKTSNQELIEYIFSEENSQNFEKTKKLLNMPFHQYFHDIFLSEKKSWMNYLNIKSEENKYEFNNLLISLDEDDNDKNLNKKYVEKMKQLANNYEGFFLYKKTRNVGKKNDFIKSFLDKTYFNDYSKYSEQVKKIHNYYNIRKNFIIENDNNLSNTNIYNNSDNCKLRINSEEKNNDDKVLDDILKNIIINIGNGCN